MTWIDLLSAATEPSEFSLGGLGSPLGAIGAVFGAIAAMFAYLAKRQANQIHIIVNSQKTEMLKEIAGLKAIIHSGVRPPETAGEKELVARALESPPLATTEPIVETPPKQQEQPQQPQQPKT